MFLFSKRHFSLTLLSVFLMTLPLQAAWLDSAISAYNAGNYQEAIRILQPRAKAGDADANYYLGQIYRMGRGVEPDNEQAKLYYLEAANRDHVDAQRNLGSLYFFEAEEKADNPDAIHWLTRAAEKGDAWSQWFLGKMYINGQGVEKDVEAAYKWFDAAGKQNHPQAQQAAAEIRAQLAIDDTEQQAEPETSEISIVDSSPEPEPAASQPSVIVEDEPDVTDNLIEPVIPDKTKENIQTPKASGFVVQLAAFASRTNAEKGQSLLQPRLADLLDNQPINIHEVVKSETQSSFKLQIGPFEKSGQASALCRDIKEKGEDCFVSKLSD